MQNRDDLSLYLACISLLNLIAQKSDEYKNHLKITKWQALIDLCI